MVKNNKICIGLRKVIGRFTGSFGILLLWLLLLILTGCGNIEELIEEEPAEEQSKVTVTFSIANSELNTELNSRALANPEDGKLSNLYIVAIPEAISNETPMHVFTVASSYDDKTLRDDYQEFRVQLYPAKYKFYVLGNLDMYSVDEDGQTTLQKVISDLTSDNAEDQLKKLTLYFGVSQNIEPGHLPMACLPSELRSGSTTSNPVGESNPFIEVKEVNNPTIYANLKFLCSKVRYTILFDNTQPTSGNYSGGISAEFGTSVMDFDRPYVTNIRKRSSLFSNFQFEFSGFVGQELTESGFSGSPANWPIELEEFAYPTNTAYPTGMNDRLTTKNDDEWNRGKRAWQGIAYLPENLLTGEDQKTVLYFPYKIINKNGLVVSKENVEKTIILFGGNSNESHTNGTPIGLTRGMMYDIVVSVRTPDDMDVKVYGRTKPWDYEGREEEW